jgi:two-component system, NtrC family, response regulator HupR/HoxA
VSEALLRHKWNHSRAAVELGISRVGSANKIKRYNLDRVTAH